jgi:hypothetical protein
LSAGSRRRYRITVSTVDYQPFKTTKVGHVEQFFRSHAVALLVDSTKNTTEPVSLFDALRFF